MTTIDCYFTVMSPWAYLGHEALHRVAAHHGAAIAYKPFSLPLVFPETGGVPLAKRHPARRAYRLIELRRWRDFRGVALNLRPRHFPTDPGLIDRTILAAIEAGHDVRGLVGAGYRAIWAEERDIAEEATIRDLVAAADLDPDRLLAAARREEIMNLYAAHSEAAVALGIVGSPGYVLDGEPFWGQDRIELIDAALSTRRRPYRIEEV